MVAAPLASDHFKEVTHNPHPIVEDDPQTVNDSTTVSNNPGVAVDSTGADREGLLKATAEDYDAIGLDRKRTSRLHGLGMRHGHGHPGLFLGALSDVDEQARACRPLVLFEGPRYRDTLRLLPAWRWRE